MTKQIYDEKNGLSYTLHGDYYLPDLEINEEEPTYGKYGIMRKQFLKEHRSARYQYLVLTGKLTEQLNQVDKEAREKVEMLMEQSDEEYDLQHVKEELADVLVYSQNLLDKLELDADEIINMKMSQNEAKYPVDKAKGSAAKYDQL